MSGFSYRVVMGVAAALALASPSAHAKPPAPYEMVRSLEALQDQIAAGSTAAQAALPKLIARMSERFLAADTDLWRVRKNAQAAAIYLFSGGRADSVRTVLERGTLAKEDQPIVKGALAYAEGHDREAKALLMPLDANGLPSILGAHLALVQATLIADADPQKATKLLDLARLLAPGTLVEEAALRREIFVVSEKKDVARFATLSRRYVRRFKNSVYAGNFRDRLRSTVKAIGVSGDAAKLPGIETLARQLEPDEQRKLYLSVARNAVLRGDSAVAGYAAAKAAALSRDGSTELARSSLYLGASMILTNNYSKGVDVLGKVDRSLLAKRDGELFDAVATVTQAVRKPAEPAVAAGGSDNAGNADAASYAEKDTAVMEMARSAIADVDALLKKSPK